MNRPAAALVVAAACGTFWLAPRRPVPGPTPPPPPPTEVIEVPPSACEAVAARVVEKERLLARLIAGDVTLAGAVEEFQALNRGWPPSVPEWYDNFPGRTFGERVAGALIAAVRVRVTSDAREAEVLDRLACELVALADPAGAPAR